MGERSETKGCQEDRVGEWLPAAEKGKGCVCLTGTFR